MTQNELNAEAMNAALDAIHEEASRALSLVPSESNELSETIELIISLSRYKFDVRNS